MTLYTEPKTEPKPQPIKHHRDFECELCHRWYSLEEAGWCEDCGVFTCPKCGHECPWKEVEED